MEMVAQIAEAMQYVLNERARVLGRETGFIERERKLRGDSFCQALVFGWLGEPQASMETLRQSAANVSVSISRQGLDKRFTPQAAIFLRAVLAESIQQVIGVSCLSVPVLSQFNGVYLLDSTVIELLDGLMGEWEGVEGSALKVSVCWELLSGALEEVHLHDGREHDQRAPMQTRTLPKGSLRISDLGYFSLDVMQHIGQDGSYWLTRYKQGTAISDDQGQRLDVVAYLAEQSGDQIDIDIRLGARHQLPCRLVAQRVPPDKLCQRQQQLRHWEQKHQRQASPQRWALLVWSLLVTNTTRKQLSAQQVVDVGHVRWQIELLFKLWKSEVDIDDWRSENPWRVLCEVYAKLIACIIQHWLLLIGHVHQLHRSFSQAATTIRQKAWQLAEFLANRRLLQRTIRTIANILRSGCRISTSTTSPPTFQRFCA